MGKFNEYSQKATPADNDTMMIYDAAAKANKLSPFSGIWNWIVGKLTNAVISNLQTNNKTIIGALNELNSKPSLRTINNNISDWDSVTKVGVYSGLGTAKNSPINSSGVWVDAIVLATNGNSDFLNLIAFSTRGELFCRRMDNKVWNNWIQIK